MSSPQARSSPKALRVQVPAAFQPLLQPGARYYAARGGRGSAKSHFFAERLILRCYAKRTRAVCIREVQKSLDNSVKQLLEDKIDALKLHFFFRVRDTWIEAYNGSLIIFQGMQNHTADSIKSLEGYDVAWVEEAQTLSQRSLDLLRPTIRKPGSEIWFSWNPENATDPVDAFLVSEKPANAIVVRVSFRDNPWFSSELREEMEHDKRADPDRYAHIWLGQYRQLSAARVFTNWRIGEPHEFLEWSHIQRLYLGSDFGFSQDPSVLVACYIDGRNLYIRGEAYAVGCDIDHMPFLFAGTESEEVNRFNEVALSTLPFENRRTWAGIPKCWQWPITAESARPETISYLQRHGFPKMVAAKKGAGSVEDGIEFLKKYNIIVHPDCVHTIDELTKYAFKIDAKTNKVLPILVDKDNHVIDALRYSVEDLRRAKAGFW